MPAITVVIPLYNKEKYIENTLRSVLNQTFRNFEVLVIDDGSIDTGPEIVKKFDDDRIKYIFQKHMGVSAARNKGIEQSESPCIAFLDADDFWNPEFLNTVYSLKKEFVNAKIFATANSSFSFVNDPQEKKIITFKDYLDICVKFKISPLNSSSVMVEKKALEHIGGFPLGQQRGEDLDTWFRLLENYDCAYANVVLSFYNQGLPDSVCKNIEVTDEGPLLTEIEKKLQNNYYSESYVQSLKSYLSWRRLMFMNAVLNQKQLFLYKKRILLHLLKSNKLLKDYLLRLLQHAKRNLIHSK